MHRAFKSKPCHTNQPSHLLPGQQRVQALQQLGEVPKARWKPGEGGWFQAGGGDRQRWRARQERELSGVPLASSAGSEGDVGAHFHWGHGGFQSIRLDLERRAVQPPTRTGPHSLCNCLSSLF